MKIAGAMIKPEWLMYGALAGIAILWLMGRQDRNFDGKPDGIARGLGFDLGRAVPDAVVGTFDGLLDGLADPLGGSYSDCERYKRDGNKLGIYAACWPKDWPVFN